LFCATLSAELSVARSKKTVLFFFMAYEGQRTSDLQQVTREVPTLSMQEGYLKYLCDPGSDPIAPPRTQTINVVGGGTNVSRI
jgi:hypothetical protein